MNTGGNEITLCMCIWLYIHQNIYVRKNVNIQMHMLRCLEILEAYGYMYALKYIANIFLK